MSSLNRKERKPREPRIPCQYRKDKRNKPHNIIKCAKEFLVDARIALSNFRTNPDQTYLFDACNSTSLGLSLLQSFDSIAVSSSYLIQLEKLRIGLSKLMHEALIIPIEHDVSKIEYNG